MEFDALIQAFYEVCLIPSGDDDELFLFETGTNGGYFDIHLVRQYNSPDEDNDEYLQLSLDIRCESTEFTSSFNTCEWLESPDEFIEAVRSSAEYTYISEHNVKIVTIGAYLDET